MYLRRMELIGFKSFADKTELEFGAGITAIVGPNGSGKSNVCDALRWVLGELSARELRGSRMEDVIFSGSAHRKPLGYAQISITFDNSSQTLPLAFTEVQISRRVDRSGASEYFINQQPCRLKDILDLFWDTGIGKINYSIVGQGQIDQILAAKPEERRHLFEEAAGIAKYKIRKREAGRRLAETEQNLLRLGDLTLELTDRLRALAVQAEIAGRYGELSARVSELEISILACQLQEASHQLTRQQEESLLLSRRLHEVDLGLADLETAAAGERMLAATLDEELTLLQGQLVENTAGYERAEGRMAVLAQEWEQTRREETRLNTELAALVEGRDKALTEAAAAAENLGIVSEDIARAQANLAGQELAVAALKLESDGTQRTGDEKRAMVMQTAQIAAGLRSEIAVAAKAADLAAANRADLMSEYESLTAAVQNATAAEAGGSGLIADLEHRHTAAQKALEAARQAEVAQTLRMQKAAADLARVRERKEAVRSRLGLLNEMKAAFEGFGRGPRQVLLGRERGQPWAAGVLGAVAELVRADAAYELALEVALGGALQNIVTDTEATARGCIAALKQSGAGRATFLPLDTIRPGSFRPEELQELALTEGFIGVALDLCRFDPRVRPALANLLGRVAVAQNLDAAVAMGRNSRFRHRIVTIGGELVHPGGAMTGGARDLRATGMLAREREREELEAEAAALENALTVQEESARNIQAAHAAAIQERRNIEVLGQGLATELAAAKAAQEHHVANLARQRSALQAVQDEIAASDQRAATGLVDVRRLEQELQGQEKAQAELERQLEVLAESSRGLLGKTDTLAGEITATRVQIAGLQQEQKSQSQRQTQLLAEAEKLADAAALHRAELVSMAKRQETLEADVAEAKAAADELAAAGKSLAQQIESRRRRRAESQEENNRRERDLRSTRRRQADLLSRVSQNDVMIAKLQAETDGHTARLAEQFQLTPPAVAGRELPAAAVEPARREVQNLREEIRALGPVNLAAIAEHAEAEARLEFLQAQSLDLEEAKAALYHAIQELDRRMVLQFQESFQVIRREFQQVYAELFVGGHADLVLIDAENPLETGIDMTVQPPGKKPVPLSLLSGGERAMTGIALMFALLRYKPTPFVLLDEVEAALDEANVDRVAQFLRQLAANTQFICITHQRGTMEAADALYGVTMEGSGVSQVVSVRFGS